MKHSQRTLSALGLMLLLIAALAQPTLAAPLQGVAVVNLPVPYIHQVYDTPDSFDGRGACGPTSTAMALAYFRKLAPNPITISTPYRHTNDYGGYVPGIFPYIDRGQGVYWGYIKQYLREQHGLESEEVRPPTFAALKSALDQGYPVILGTFLTPPPGHIILVRGYTNDNRLIVNDPYGDRARGYYNYSGENIQYSQSDALNGTWMLIVKGVADTDDNRAITSGQSVSGTISPNTDQDSYQFTGAAGAVVRVSLSRTSGGLDPVLEVYGPNNQRIAYNDDKAQGVLDSESVVTLPSAGSYRIIASSYQGRSGGGYRLELAASSADGDDGRWLAFGQSLRGTISPTADRDTYYFNAGGGTGVSISMNREGAPLDGYLELYGPTGVRIAENDDGGGSLNPLIIKQLPTSGVYRVVARSHNHNTGGSYSLSLNTVRSGAPNLALNKRAFAFGQESRFPASHATDGNRTSRWSSGNKPINWMRVDFGQDYNLNQVIIRWERAYGPKYDVSYWDAAANRWRVVFSTNTSDGDVDVINFSQVRTRYIQVWMRGFKAPFTNYSIWELEAYNSTSLLLPLVPPEDPDKPIEADVTPLTPLAPDPEGKDAPIPALASDQENEPLLDLSAVEENAPTDLHVTYDSPTTTLTLSSNIILEGSQVTGNAAGSRDQDSQQDGTGIIAYRWFLSAADISPPGGWSELIGDDSSVVIPASLLLPGSYVVTLEVQDDEGVWSDLARAPLQVLPRTKVFLPVLAR